MPSRFPFGNCGDDEGGIRETQRNYRDKEDKNMTNGINPVKEPYWFVCESKENSIASCEYPNWICRECAESSGCRNRCQVSTYHEDLCGWCGRRTAVTQPRDYGYPKFSKKECS